MESSVRELFQCSRCNLSFSTRHRLNEHISHHRYEDTEKKKHEELKQLEYVRMMQALLAMTRMGMGVQGGLGMDMLEPNPAFWAGYRIYGTPPTEIDFVGQLSSRRVKPKSKRAKRKGAMDIDLTLKL